MSDYIEREKAIAEFSNNGSVFVYGEKQCKAIVSRLNTIPAADVVEVIRCRDCRFFITEIYGDSWCSAKSSGVSLGMCTPNADSYCSDAERKEA